MFLLESNVLHIYFKIFRFHSRKIYEEISVSNPNREGIVNKYVADGGQQ